MFGALARLALNRENVYYRRPKNGRFKLPARLLWYVAKHAGGPGIYVSPPRCALEGAFAVERGIEAAPSTLWGYVSHNAGITRAEFNDYFGERETANAIVVRKVWRLTPVTLSAMWKVRIRLLSRTHAVVAKERTVWRRSRCAT